MPRYPELEAGFLGARQLINNIMEAIVKYRVATYEGEINVPCEMNDDDAMIIAKAKEMLKRQTGEFPLGYQSWKVIGIN